MRDPVFYFSVPQGDRTGGPECMHRLADALSRRGLRSVLVPMRNFRGRVPDPEYSNYAYELSDRIEEKDRAVLVLGEVSPIETHRELRQVPENRTWLWWLSVHNGPDPRSRYFRGSSSCCATQSRSSEVVQDSPTEIPVATQVVRRTSYADASTTGLLRESWVRTTASYSPGKNPRTLATEFASLLYNRRLIESGVGFLAQSVYAQGFCQSILGRRAFPMTDYLRRPIVSRRRLEENVVLYNGAKGDSMIRDLAPLLPHMSNSGCLQGVIDCRGRPRISALRPFCCVVARPIAGTISHCQIAIEFRTRPIGRAAWLLLFKAL